MNSSDLNYERALEYAKSMAGYSNLARCYIAATKRLATLDKKSVVQQYIDSEPEVEPSAPEPVKEIVATPEPVKRKPGRPRKEESNEIDL